MILIPATIVEATDGVCPEGMVWIGSAGKKGFCIDRLEAHPAPAEGERPGRPYVGLTGIEAREICRSQGKRLCTLEEWTRACQGRSKRRYVYGDRYRRGGCVDRKTWRNPRWSAIKTYPAERGRREIERLDQSEPVGSMPGCVSEDGVLDMNGNAAEWVTAWGTMVVKGGYWAGTPRGCLYTNAAHPPEFRSYEFGVRCCQDSRESNR